MIFSHDYKGKTQTRRLVKSGQYAEYYQSATDTPYGDADWIIRVFEANGRIKWEVGRTYAMCRGRGKPAYARFKLLEIRKENVQSITNLDAIDEGITHWIKEQSASALWKTMMDDTPNIAFSALWDTLHLKNGNGWKINPLVWVLTYEVKQ